MKGAQLKGLANQHKTDTTLRSSTQFTQDLKDILDIESQDADHASHSVPASEAAPLAAQDGVLPDEMTPGNNDEGFSEEEDGEVTAQAGDAGDGTGFRISRRLMGDPLFKTLNTLLGLF